LKSMTIVQSFDRFDRNDLKNAMLNQLMFTRLRIIGERAMSDGRIEKQ
jgi:hypothetical protein